MTLSLKGTSDSETKTKKLSPEFKASVVLEALRGESSQAELCRQHNISEEQLSKWKRQLLENAAILFDSRNKPSNDATERIAQLEQLLGRLTLAVDVHKKASTWLETQSADNTLSDIEAVRANIASKRSGNSSE